MFVEPRGAGGTQRAAKLTTSDGTANGWLGRGCSVGNDGVRNLGRHDRHRRLRVRLCRRRSRGPLCVRRTEERLARCDPNGGADRLRGARATGSHSVAIQGSRIVGRTDSRRSSRRCGARGRRGLPQAQGGWRNETKAAKLTSSRRRRMTVRVTVGGPATLPSPARRSPPRPSAGRRAPRTCSLSSEALGASETETADADRHQTALVRRDAFGGAVAVSYGTVAAGAPNYEWPTDRCSNDPAGAVYVSAEPEGGWRSATETAKLTASDGAGGDGLGELGGGPGATRSSPVPKTPP